MMRSVYLLPLMLSAAFAQAPAAAFIVHVEGVVYLNDRPVAEGDAAAPLADNATVRTAAGRVEIHLAAGDTLFLGEHAGARVAANQPYNFNRIELLAGPAVILTGKMGSQFVCENSARLSDSGIFRIDRTPFQDGSVCDLKVYQGSAAVQMPSYLAVLIAGHRMAVDHRCGDMIPTLDFDARQTDALDDWSRARAHSAK